MDEGASKNDNKPPPYHRLKWVGHGLYLRE